MKSREVRLLKLNTNTLQQCPLRAHITKEAIRSIREEDIKYAQSTENLRP